MLPMLVLRVFLLMKTFLLIALSLVAALSSPLAQAGAFSVNPLRVDLSAKQTGAMIQVKNTGDAALTLQLSVMAWSQADGEDRLSRSRDLLATPPMFTIAPGATQAVRIGALRKPEADTELPYRLLLQEIPSSGQADFTGLHVALNVSMPVFLHPLRPGQPALDARLERTGEQEGRLRLVNDGLATAYLHNLVLYRSHDAAVLATHPAAVYVLPGQQREIRVRFSSPAADLPLRLRAAAPSGPIDLDVISSLP